MYTRWHQPWPTLGTFSWKMQTSLEFCLYKLQDIGAQASQTNTLYWKAYNLMLSIFPLLYKKKKVQEDPTFPDVFIIFCAYMAISPVTPLFYFQVIRYIN